MRVNKIIEEWAIMGITKFEAESRFLAHAARGSTSCCLKALAELAYRDKEVPASIHEKEPPPYNAK